MKLVQFLTPITWDGETEAHKVTCPRITKLEKGRAGTLIQLWLTPEPKL